MKQQSKIKELLKKENLTLEEILEQNDFADEFKNKNQKLLEFFTETNFKKLLDYLMTDPIQKDNKQAIYKYPLTVCEIFSNSMDNVTNFFLTKNSDNKLEYFHYLFDEFKDENGNIKKSQINFTRVGYIQKILNNLMISKPKIFIEEMINSEIIIDCLIYHSYSKSSINILLHILTLPTNKNDQLKEKDNKEQQQLWIQGTLTGRLKIFKKLIELSLKTSDQEEDYFLNEHICVLIILTMNQEFSDKEKFIELLFENYLKKIGEQFIKNFSILINDKIGNIFQKSLKIILDNKSKYLKYFDFNYFVQQFLQLFINNTLKIQSTSVKFISSYNQQISKINIKMFKLLEILIMFVKEIIERKEINILIEHQIQNGILFLFQNYPMNNILHLKLYKLIMLLIESKDNNFMEEMFLKNKQFEEFLQKRIEEYSNKQLNQKLLLPGYFGHLKEICMKLEENINKNQFYEGEIWQNVKKQFLEIEETKEKSIFKDFEKLDEKSIKNSCQFYFSIEDIKLKYNDFLHFSEKPKSIENQQFDDKQSSSSQEELEELVEKKEIEIQSKELREEMDKLDVMNIEETSYQDSKYWKTSQLYEIETLMSELKLDQLIIIINFVLIRTYIQIYNSLPITNKQLYSQSFRSFINIFQFLEYNDHNIFNYLKLIFVKNNFFDNLILI